MDWAKRFLDDTGTEVSLLLKNPDKEDIRKRESCGSLPQGSRGSGCAGA
jgi:hypothetical protein